MTGSPHVISLVSRGREPSLRPPEKVVARERSTGPQGRLIEKSEMEKGVPFSGERGKRARGSPERGKDCEEGRGARGEGGDGTARTNPSPPIAVYGCAARRVYATRSRLHSSVRRRSDR